MKPRFLTIISLFLFALFLANQSSATLSEESSNVGTGAVSNKIFSENSVGAGLSAGLRFNMAEDIFIESEDKNSKNKDHIFTEIELFGNQFFSGEIKQNFGGRLNLGYEIKGLRIYGSGGYVASTIDYKETSNTKQSYTGSAPFYGIGFGYDLTKNISLRLNSMFYNFNFKPKNSEFKSVEINVSAVNLGLGLHF